MFNGIEITRVGDTIFIPLPRLFQTEIKGGCNCDFCRSHPNEIPAWDTIAVDATGTNKRTWTVHAPEFHKK
jgi:hypothetical protein